MLSIYKASAGSGKTFTLAYEYIRALLGIKPPGQEKYRLNFPKYSPEMIQLPDRHRHILAITFTNKATEEMKRRIIDELDRLGRVPTAGDKDSGYASMLCNEYRCSRQELAEVAGTALAQLLYDYHSFNVTTIDSFFQRVLRTFARELDRPGDFNIELNDVLAVQQAVDNMLDDFNLGISAKPKLKGAMDFGDWLFRYLSRQIDEGKKSNFFNRSSHLHTSLVSLIATICDEHFRPYTTRMQQYLADPAKLAAFTKQLDNLRNAVKVDIKNLAQTTKDILIAEGVYDKVKDNVRYKKLIELALDTNNDPETKKYTDETYQKFVDGSTKYFVQAPLKNHPGAIDAIIDFVTKAQKKVLDLAVLSTIRKALTQLGLLAFAWPYIDLFTADTNTILLSDTNHLLSTIIGGEETPFIYERMGVQLHHFLIDEFQDTSHMQWNNLRPLVHNSMGEDFDNLIIGDEKQSIYRFRNSDPELLHTIVANEHFPNPPFDTQVRGGTKGENTNYRSAAEVVRFNNTLFTVLSQALNVEGYENVIQEIPEHHLDYHGYVHFIPFGKDKDKEKNEEKDYELLKTMVETMRSQHQRGYKWSDMAILARTNKEAVMVVEYLISEAKDIPVLSEEALYLKKSPAIMQIISMLRLMEQQTSAASDPSKPYITPTPAEVSVIISRFEYYRSLDHNEAEAMDMAVKSSRSGNKDDCLIASLDSIKRRKPSTIVSLVETIIHEMLSDTSDSQIAYLTAFQDFVVDYSSRYNPTLTSFLNAWEKLKDDLTIPMAATISAVRVMTVHKSKGLEFKCVHIPFASWDVSSKFKPHWLEVPHIPGIDDELRPPVIYIEPQAESSFPHVFFHDVYVKDRHNALVDLMNVIYVAYTRAETELNVYYDPTAGIGKWLCQAFTVGNPDPQNPLLCNLNSPTGDIDNEYAWGIPTILDKPDDKKETSGTTVIDRELDDYKVFFHADVDVLTRVTDVLELDSDVSIDDDDMPDHPSDEIYSDAAARDRGLLLHDALSMIGSTADIGRAVRRMAKLHRLDPDEADDLAKVLSSMLATDDMRIRRWFGPDADAATEQSVFMPGRSMTRRPDRLVFNPDGMVEVIDYKFTSEPSPSHTRQVREYINLLHEMGYDKVRGFIWYPLFPSPTIIEVESDNGLNI